MESLRAIMLWRSFCVFMRMSLSVLCSWPLCGTKNSLTKRLRHISTWGQKKLYCTLWNYGGVSYFVDRLHWCIVSSQFIGSSNYYIVLDQCLVTMCCVIQWIVLYHTSVLYHVVPIYCITLCDVCVLYQADVSLYLIDVLYCTAVADPTQRCKHHSNPSFLILSAEHNCSVLHRINTNGELNIVWMNASINMSNIPSRPDY